MPMVGRRLRDPDINPCLSESDASTRCMDENNYDREKCSTYFLKYKNCRKFWTSAATLSPGVSSRGWDDGDTRSEHGHSESGTTGSSFEELELEGEGPLGLPRLSPEAEPLGTVKWPREPSTPREGNSVMIQRRQNGVQPSMPTAAERDEILGAMGKMPY
ncbi:coiled-coil-helix-coiled-coil-helix domain-containing protein 7 isoform X1 [Prionailurus iriomotensis]